VLRDRGGVFDAEVVQALRLELGDVLWYVAQLATELELDLADIATANLEKLASRAARDVLGGDGDDR
jgi:NTP pyrophosphatase (non-canonical NTP hydrolase)